MSGPRFGTLLRLRLRLVAARIADIPPWQVALFGIAWALAVTISGVLLPVLIPVFRALDEGLIAGSIVLMLASLAVIGVHLLVAEGSDQTRAKRRIDPMDLLPVPASWSFYLSVIDESLSDPAALLIVPSALLGLVLASRERWMALALVLVLGPLMLAVLAAVRITATHAARAIIPPRLARVGVRGITYVSLLVTVGVGGTLVYDLFTFSRHTAEGLEPLNLMSSSVGLWLHDAFLRNPMAARLLPPSWPVLALTGGPGWPLWFLLTVLSATLALLAMAQLHGKFLAHPPLEGTASRVPDRPSLLARLLVAWLPIAPAPVIALEADVAAHRGLISEALVEGGLLLGSLLLLVALAPQMYARSFVDGFKFLGGLLTLLLTTPAASIAREGAGVTMRLLLPSRQHNLLLAKVPVIALRNVMLVMPSGLALAFVLPMAPPLKVLSAAVLLAMICLVAAMAAVGAGMVVAPLVEATSSFGRQVVALGLCGLTLSPLTLMATATNPYHAAAGVMAAGLMVAGLWQKSLARLAMLAHPTVEKAPSYLLGDAALGALLYVLAGSALATLLQGATGMDHDRSMLLSMLVLQLLVIRYTVGYLFLRCKDTGEALGLSGPGRHWALGAGFGLLCGVVALGYGWFLSEVLDIDARSGGGPISRMVAEMGEHPVEGLFALIAAAILAPISEELLFRRLIFLGILQASGRLGISAVLSGLFFAIVHPAAGFPLIFTVGVISSMLLARLGSLAPCFAFHMAFNSVQLVALIYFGKA